MSTDKTQIFIQLLKDENQIVLNKLYDTAGWRDGINVEKVYHAISQLNNSSIHYIIGYIHYCDNGTSSNYKNALPCLRSSAEAGNSHAQYLLGHMYHYGFGVDQNDEKAFKYYLLSADQGKMVAQLNAAMMIHDTKQDYRRALHYYQLCAKQIEYKIIKNGEYSYKKISNHLIARCTTIKKILNLETKKIAKNPQYIKSH